MRVFLACIVFSLLLWSAVGGPVGGAAEADPKSTTGVQDTSGVEGTLSPGADANKPYVLTFTLKNVGQQPFTFLKWNSPFDSVQSTSLFTLLPPSMASKSPKGSDSFAKKIADELGAAVASLASKLKEIAEGEAFAPYTGPEIERNDEDATADDFITLKPGEEKAAQVDLFKNYAMNKGAYVVKINFAVLLVQLEGGKIKSSEVRPLHGQMNLNVVEESPSYAHFKKSGKPTTGMAMLEMMTRNKRAHSAERVKATTYTGCNATYLADVKAAVAAAKTLLTNSKAYLNRACTWDERMQKFFGKDSATARATVNKMIDDITGKIDSVQVKCCDTGTVCSDGTNGESPYSCNAVAYAWKFYYPDTIHLCTQTWLQKSTTHTARGTRASTIIHEISHLFDTDDHGYRETTIFPMAYEDQAKALTNADTYALFHSYGDAFPAACNDNAPAVAACGGTESTYVSDPIDDCEGLFKSTYNAEVTVKKEGDATTTLKQTVAASIKGPNLRWGSTGAPPPEVAVKGAIATTNRKCCVVACSGGASSTFQVFARDAGKTTCAATPSA